MSAIRFVCLEQEEERTLLQKQLEVELAECSEVEATYRNKVKRRMEFGIFQNWIIHGGRNSGNLLPGSCSRLAIPHTKRDLTGLNSIPYRSRCKQSAAKKPR